MLIHGLNMWIQPLVSLSVLFYLDKSVWCVFVCITLQHTVFYLYILRSWCIAESAVYIKHDCLTWKN